MPERINDKSESRGYSLPKSLHSRITKAAAAREISASQLVRRAVNYYLREVLSDPEHGQRES